MERDVSIIDGRMKERSEVVIMKRTVRIVFCLFLIVLLTACTGNPIKHPYVQEYVAGQGNCKGNVNTAYFLELDSRFEIGANAEGYAVFKDPDAAFDAVKEKYADGIKLIQRENKLAPFSKKNYKLYGTYGWQVTSGSKEEKEQAFFISQFIDIYENSYEDVY